MAHEARKRLDHDAYTVAWLCPLEVEMSAARYLLDEEHQRLHAAAGDRNQYVLGQVNGHNVVIASLSAGYQGTVSAATVAIHLSRTFPSVRLRLLVGIGGGVPSKKNDVRLGDVVVGIPTDIYGGVVQYDLGKQTSTAFERKGFLSPPPTEWLQAATLMKSDHRIAASKVSAFLNEMLERYPRLTEYKRPPTTEMSSSNPTTNMPRNRTPVAAVTKREPRSDPSASLSTSRPYTMVSLHPATA